uniref:hypothetical protein n=1 Tax=Coprococcus catus TaxID=116085 RepID=UPI0022DF6EA3|nr:hypothetical protein [Coprococcus catus]
MSEKMLSIRDLKIIDADAYARGALGVTAETIMDVAADVVDMLIVREHYKISSALHIVGMSAEQYVAVRAKEADRWWDREETEDEEKAAAESEKKETFDEADAKEKIKNLIQCVKFGVISFTQFMSCFEGPAREFVQECGKEIGIDLEEKVRRENSNND